MKDKTAGNKQFGIMQRVHKQTVQWEFGSLSPVATLVPIRPNAKPQERWAQAEKKRSTERQYSEKI